MQPYDDVKRFGVGRSLLFLKNNFQAFAFFTVAFLVFVETTAAAVVVDARDLLRGTATADLDCFLAGRTCLAGVAFLTGAFFVAWCFVATAFTLVVVGERGFGAFCFAGATPTTGAMAGATSVVMLMFEAEPRSVTVIALYKDIS